MNFASQVIQHHLAILSERLLSAADYETAFNYFLEKLGGDKDFIALGKVEELLTLPAVLINIATQALGKPVKLENVRLAHVLGLGVRPNSAAEMARSRLPAALAVDPGRN